MNDFDSFIHTVAPVVDRVCPSRILAPQCVQINAPQRHTAADKNTNQLDVVFDSKVAGTLSRSSRTQALMGGHNRATLPVEEHMLGHISLGVRDLTKAQTFYDATLLALGYARTDASDTSVGYGLPGTGSDRLRLVRRADAAPPGPGFHLAFVAHSQAAVDRFHEAALQSGGRDEGAPGFRPQYGPRYYAAFVRDPDGHKLEAKHPPPLA